jgi:hypothetical protein
MKTDVEKEFSRVVSDSRRYVALRNQLEAIVDGGLPSEFEVVMLCAFRVDGFESMCRLMHKRLTAAKGEGGT